MPKRVPALSAKRLAATRPTDRAIELIDGFLPGLRVRILPSGAHSWSLNIRDNKGFVAGSASDLVSASLTLGVGARTFQRAVRDGGDPTEERRAARRRSRAARDGFGTFGALLATYFLKGPGASQRRAAKTKRLIEKVLAEVLEQPGLDIDRSRLQLIVDNWQVRRLPR
jgi:hypothetical protein